MNSGAILLTGAKQEHVINAGTKRRTCKSVVNEGDKHFSDSHKLK